MKVEPETMPPPDPFALPAETDGRFRMLIVVAVLLVWSLAGQILDSPRFVDVLVEIGPNYQRLVGRQMDQVRDHPFQLEMPGIEELEVLRASGELEKMKAVAQLWLQRFLLSLMLLAVFLVVAAATYLYVPTTYRLEPLEPRAAPRVVAEMRQAALRAGLAAPPDLYLKDGMFDGLAIVRWRRPIVALAGAAGSIEKMWSDLHRAVALHEIGHFVNGDIRKRELARAVWVGLAGALLVAILLFLVLRRPAAWQLFGFLGRTLGVVTIAWSLWAGLVRIREYYADWRVVTWGMGRPLERRLGLPQVGPAAGRKWIRFKLPWEVHPTNGERLHMLRNPAGLFVASPLLAGLTGALLGLLVGNVEAVATDLLAVFSQCLGVGAKAISPYFLLLGLLSLVVPPIALVVLGRWITDALGAQVFRSALFELGRMRPADWGYLKLARLAVAFVVGLELAISLTPAAFFGWQNLAFMAAWWPGLTALVWIWLVQNRALGRLVLGACSDSRYKASVVTLLRWFASLQLAVVFLPALAWRLAAFAVAVPGFLVQIRDGGETLESSVQFLLMSGWMFLAASFFFFAALGFALFGIAAIGLVARKGACPDCRAPQRAWRAVGVRCANCGGELASWFYSTVRREQ